MRYYDGRYLIYDSETKFKASELTEEALEALGGPDVVALRKHEGTGLILPFIRNKKTIDPNNFNMGAWFQSMINNADKKEHAIKAVSKKLADKGVDFTEEDVRNIVNIPIEANARKDSAVSKALLEYTAGDAEASITLRRRVMSDDVPYRHPNKTYNQTVNTDPVGIRLQEADIIVSHIIGESYSETPFASTLKQYPNRLYRTKQIVSILTANTAKTRVDNIQKTIDALRSSYKVAIPADEETKLKRSFEILPLDYVIGNPDNDTAPIYPNEQDFYENLVDFIKFHIEKFNKEVMSSATEEEIKLKSEQDFNAGVIPVRLQEYLDQIITDASKENFYHTGNFNYEVGDYEEDAHESDKTGDDQFDDDLKIIVAKDDTKKSDLNYFISDYLSISAKTFGCSVWAEGIIKIMRWGDRKIRNLNVGINNTQYLDLQKLSLVTQQLADLSQFEVESDEQGRTLDALALAYCDFIPEGEKRAKSYPFIIVGTEYGKLPGVEDSVTVTYITTLFDIVRTYKLGNPNIYDLGYDNGKFFDEFDRDPLTVLELEEITIDKRKVKILDELTDYGIDNNVTKMQGTSFSIIRQEDLEEYKARTPLIDRLPSIPKQMRTSAIQGSLLAIFQEGAENFESDKLVDILNWYHDNVYPIHEQEYKTVFGFSDAQDAAPAINARNYMASKLFTQDAVVEETQEESDEFVYPIYEGPELQFNKIERNAKDNTVIGGYAIAPDGTRVYASVDEISTFSVGGETVQTGKILLNLFATLVSADPKNNYDAKTKVISSETIFKIYKDLVNLK